jgi:hypothetical protein
VLALSYDPGRDPAYWLRTTLDRPHGRYALLDPDSTRIALASFHSGLSEETGVLAVVY